MSIVPPRAAGQGKQDFTPHDETRAAIAEVYISESATTVGKRTSSDATS
jgi:hypothetical protein